MTRYMLTLLGTAVDYMIDVQLAAAPPERTGLPWPWQSQEDACMRILGPESLSTTQHSEQLTELQESSMSI